MVIENHLGNIDLLPKKDSMNEAGHDIIFEHDKTRGRKNTTDM